ncbi:efflux RND transporter periplasmic adaptor subunit [Jiella mangrovi]|uniref:Efflux RND transporter periplasmic adaptor subunit n=1 Tax=Jiella mangrovi TaxID=2821407 RepID=A0ABS4BLU5_9HYPH|nr:efflux RND transporter periplasmic adaptor subunit [Jiella mangrovi]MBP0617684.1 efflux RND transporter periplasmic adaptor subunit [Jiella mangrovi]
MRRPQLETGAKPAPFRRIAPLAALVIVLAALGACSDSGGSEGSGGSAAKGAGGAPGGQAGPTKVGVVTVEPQPVTITANVAGRVVSFQTAQVRPQVGGLITERLFEQGTKVEKGQVLYKLDDRSYKAEVDSAKATLEKNQAALTTAQLQYQRYQDLGKNDVISQSDRDSARSTYLQAKADVAVAQAALETAQLNLNYTSIEAPITGRVGTDPTEPGNLVTADQTDALATIRQIDPVYVDFTESSGNLMKFRDQIRRGGVKALVGPENPGKAVVKIQFADGSSYPETGTIDAADQYVSETTSSFTVRTRFPNPENVLLPGMYVRGTIRLAVDENGFLLPQRAVSRNAKGEPTAMFVKEDGTVETRVLEISTDIGNQWWVTKGVEKGDKLIVDGLQKIRDGAKVTPVAVTVNDDGLVEQASDQDQSPASAKGGADDGKATSAETAKASDGDQATTSQATQTKAGQATAAEQKPEAASGGGDKSAGTANGGGE